MYSMLFHSKKIATAVASIALAFSLLVVAIPVNKVYASGPTQAAPVPDQEGQVPVEKIEKRYQRLLDISKKVGNALNRGDEFATKMADRLTKVKENGKDVTEMEVALNTFNQKLSEAHQYQLTATDILNTHTGFDNSGKVIDEKSARITLKETAVSLRDVRKTLHPAFIELRKAIREYRRSHMPTPAP